MFYNFSVADSEVVMIFYVQMFVFDPVIEFFLLVFYFFFLFGMFCFLF